jgi:hypothetical protein
MWVFGIADTSTKPAITYMQTVEKRDAATLLPIIEKVVYSDKWRAYRQIQLFVCSATSLVLYLLLIDGSKLSLLIEVRRVNHNKQSHFEKNQQYWYIILYEYCEQNTRIRVLLSPSTSDPYEHTF